MLECVEAATKKVIELGYADPKRIGVNGHSYGGEGAAFIGTQSKMFAAVGMGAGVTDLYNDFSQSWGWAYQVTRAAAARTAYDYYMYGQGRWGFIALGQAGDVPLRVGAHPRAEGVAAVPDHARHRRIRRWLQRGMNFYNALRYNGKKAYLLAYPGEGHGLRGLANRKDLTIRFFQFFDHYLKGAPAPKWMTDGVPYLKKDENKVPK